MNKNEKKLINELEDQKKLRQPMGYGGFVGTRTNMVVYDELVGKDYDIDMLRNPKELIADMQKLPNLITVERIHELEEQVKILKDLLGLTEAQLAHKLIQRAVTPNQIRAIIGLDKIETPRTNIIEDILERAEVTWHDDVTHDIRVVVSKNPEQPLTPHERQTIYDMWSKQQHYPMKCVFYAVNKKGKRILVDELPGGASYNESKK